MNNDFEKYLGNFAPIPPSGEFRQKTLAASRQAWKSSEASSSVFSSPSPRCLATCRGEEWQGDHGEAQRTKAGWLRRSFAWLRHSDRSEHRNPVLLHRELHLLFSPRSLLWAQAAMIAAAVALICVENTRTEQLLAGKHGEAANGTADEIKFFSELGLDKTYGKRMIVFKKMYAANDSKPINLAAYQKTINTIIEEGIIQ